MMSISGVEVNKTVVVGLLIILVLGLWYGLSGHFSARVVKFQHKIVSRVGEDKVRMATVDGSQGTYVRQTDMLKKTWLVGDLKSLPPNEILKSRVQNRTITFLFENQDMSVHLLQGKPSNDVNRGDLLLLHGMSFSAVTWNGDTHPPLYTIETFAALGYNTIAIDLPGKHLKGTSSKVDISRSQKGEFLAEVIKQLSLNKPVIVSPSMSGSFSLPLLFGATTRDACGGYVAVAPTHVASYKDDFKNLQVPALVLYGEKDDSMGVKTKEILELIPNSEVFMLRGARHPAYLDQPDAFHKLLYNFLLAVKS